MSAIVAPACSAAQIRFHYAPGASSTLAVLQPSGRFGTPGEQWSYAGQNREGYSPEPRPTHQVTFFHPFTQKQIQVPISFPAGTPLLSKTRDKIIFNYGSYQIQVHFLSDGSVDLVYDAGLFRFFPSSTK